MFFYPHNYGELTPLDRSIFQNCLAQGFTVFKRKQKYVPCSTFFVHCNPPHVGVINLCDIFLARCYEIASREVVVKLHDQSLSENQRSKDGKLNQATGPHEWRGVAQRE